jgi:hypothetical protein
MFQVPFYCLKNFAERRENSENIDIIYCSIIFRGCATDITILFILVKKLFIIRPEDGGESIFRNLGCPSMGYTVLYQRIYGSW